MLKTYLLSVLAVIIVTVSGKYSGVVTQIDQVLLYLLAALIIAVKLGRGPSILYSFLSVSCFNFFFIPPLYSFAVSDESYWLTFLVMLLTSLVISTQVKARISADAIAEKSKIEVETEKLRSTLLSSVSHDLRTPLATITGASSSIVMDFDNMPRKTIKTLASSINLEASRLASIVTNLLHISRMESGALTLNTQPYFIEELIGSVLLRMEPQLSNHNIVKNADNDLPVVLIDAVLIEQVLTNLLENAVKYAPAGGNIFIFANNNGGELQVSVADSGHGITPGYEKKIFDKFYTGSKHSGSGLGLTICQGVINAHGGRIWADNRMEGGAKITFTLPLMAHSENVYEQ